MQSLFSIIKKYYIKFLMIIMLVFGGFSVTAFSMPASFAPLVKKTLPAVVRIQGETEVSTNGIDFKGQNVPEGFEDLFKDFFEQQRKPKKRRGKTQGSGFIFNKDGYVLTNNHVVKNTKKIQVILNNGKKYSAKIVGVDPLTDLAVLKLQGVKKNLPTLKLGNSDKTEVGDWVIAVGSPLGVGTTVTKGIISASGRDIRSGLYDDYLQTDAPINRGNSGGPLINMAGEVVGINTIIISPTGTNIGLGFSIPSNIIKNISSQLLKDGVVKRGWLGVGLQPVTEEIAESLGLKSAKGVILTSIQKGSPADKAGLKLGDVVIGFNDKAVTKRNRLPVLVARAPVGKKISITIIRNNKIKKMTVKLVKRNDQVAVLDSNTSNAVVEEVELKGTGITVSKISSEFRKQHKLSKNIQGVVVVKIREDFPAYSFVPKWSIIERINNTPVKSIRDAQNVINLSKKQGKKNILLVLSTTNSSRLFVTVQLIK